MRTAGASGLDNQLVGGRATRYPAGYVTPVRIHRYALVDQLVGYTRSHHEHGVRVGDACIKLNN